MNHLGGCTSDSSADELFQEMAVVEILECLAEIKESASDTISNFLHGLLNPLVQLF